MVWGLFDKSPREIGDEYALYGEARIPEAFYISSPSSRQAVHSSSFGSPWRLQKWRAHLPHVIKVNRTQPPSSQT